MIHTDKRMEAEDAIPYPAAPFVLCCQIKNTIVAAPESPFANTCESAYDCNPPISPVIKR